jgi:hypothetical protein
MKDAKGHGSDPRGNTDLPAHQAGVSQIPTEANADAFVDRLRRGVMPDLSGVTRAPRWIERFGLAARRGRSPV